MDINFDISQINQNTIFVSNIAEKINQCIRDFEKLFSETQEGYDSIKKEISDILRLTDELINQADYLGKILGNKESKIPKDKDYIKKPIYQSFQNELAKQQYEVLCKNIDKENEIIKKQNDQYQKARTDLDELKVILKKTQQRLEIIKSKCFHYQTHIKNSNSEFLSNKSETNFKFKQLDALVGQTLSALNCTFSRAEILVKNSNNRVYGDLHNVFKLKSNKLKKDNVKTKKRNENFYKTGTNINQNKVIYINSRNINEFMETLENANIKVGDTVKTPSYNLFNLGNDKFLEEMKSRGFAIIEENSNIISEDNMLSWVKI